MTRDAFAAKMAPLLKESGFKKRKYTWTRDFGDVIAIFNLQGSQWSSDFYLNGSIFVKSPGGDANPASCPNHLFRRFEKIDEVNSVFSKVYSWFLENSTIDGIKKHLAANPNLPATLHLKKHLGMV